MVTVIVDKKSLLELASEDKWLTALFDHRMNITSDEYWLRDALIRRGFKSEDLSDKTRDAAVFELFQENYSNVSTLKDAYNFLFPEAAVDFLNSIGRHLGTFRGWLAVEWLDKTKAHKHSKDFQNIDTVLSYVMKGNDIENTRVAMHDLLDFSMIRDDDYALDTALIEAGERIKRAGIDTFLANSRINYLLNDLKNTYFEDKPNTVESNDDLSSSGENSVKSYLVALIRDTPFFREEQLPVYTAEDLERIEAVEAEIHSLAEDNNISLYETNKTLAEIKQYVAGTIACDPSVNINTRKFVQESYLPGWNIVFNS